MVYEEKYLVRQARGLQVTAVLSAICLFFGIMFAGVLALHGLTVATSAFRVSTLLRGGVPDVAPVTTPDSFFPGLLIVALVTAYRKVSTGMAQAQTVMCQVEQERHLRSLRDVFVEERADRKKVEEAQRKRQAELDALRAAMAELKQRE